METQKGTRVCRISLTFLVNVIEKYIQDALSRFHKAKKGNSIMTTRNLFGGIINIHPFVFKLLQKRGEDITSEK